MFFLISEKLQIKINDVIYHCGEDDFIMVGCNEKHELQALTDCRL